VQIPADILSRLRALIVSGAVLCGCFLSATAADLNSIGVTFLRSLDSSLTGTGVMVIQAEAPVAGNLFEINPAAVGQPVSLFTWLSSSGTNTTFPNAAGGESFHANDVGNAFFGTTNGVAPGVAHVDNYHANLFYNSRVLTQTPISGKIANQSFIFTGSEVPYDTAYDNYAARFGTLFVSGAGNSGTISPPATCYNGLGVAAYGGSSATGPTADGRSKPDITAPATLTSYSTPLVAGAAAILLEAANRNDGGPSTAARAGDSRTIKALLLNGAEKPSDWTHLAPAPLDLRYGAGVLNVWNAYRQLRGGKQAFNSSTSNGLGGSHLPPNITNNLPTRRGWDQNMIANASVNAETVNHYFIDVRDGLNQTFTLKATLVWQRQQNQTSINDLDVFVYDAVSGQLIASSQSLVDNVEHVYLTNLPPSRYDIQVLKNGGPTKRVTSSETYALAFELGPPEEAHIENIANSSGVFVGQVYGEPNQNYAVYRSANLISWTSVVTNKTSAEGFFDFSDTGTINRRFYRTQLVP
jgi:hypothetical protein